MVDEFQFAGERDGQRCELLHGSAIDGRQRRRKPFVGPFAKPVRAAVLCVAAVALLCLPAAAHDTWVETNTNLIRSGDAVYIDLKLGNHGNDHRDFKLASKVGLEGCTLQVVAPDGREFDIRDRLIDTGYAPKEGYWQAKFSAVEPGLYMVTHTLDQVVHYAPIRAVKSGKTYFAASQSLDRVPLAESSYSHVLGHALEIVPTANPVTPMGPGQPIEVQVLYKGEPLADARVSFVPRGTELKAEFDSRYEQRTDADGRASFEPKTGNTYLVVAHHVEPEESGEGYESTKYSATLTVFVPEICPCCGE